VGKKAATSWSLFFLVVETFPSESGQSSILIVAFSLVRSTAGGFAGWLARSTCLGQNRSGMGDCEQNAKLTFLALIFCCE